MFLYPFIFYQLKNNAAPLLFETLSRMDTGGLLGPNYIFTDEIPGPSDLGIRRDGSPGGVIRAASGLNYYIDTIGFGEPTYFAKENLPHQRPLGLRYFLKTGQTCSNGADLYEYINTVPDGLSGPVGDSVKNMMKADLRGLAPGMMEDAIGALNPMPMFKAVMGSGYAQCKKVTMPVGDDNGFINSSWDKNNVWIPEKTRTKFVRGDEMKGVSRGNKPHQTRWVFDKFISQEEYADTPKTESPGVFPDEGFCVMSDMKKPQIAAVLLFTVLLFGIVVVNK